MAAEVEAKGGASEISTACTPNCSRGEASRFKLFDMSLTLFCNVSERPWLLSAHNKRARNRRSSNIAMEVVHSMVDGNHEMTDSSPRGVESYPQAEEHQQLSPQLGYSAKEWLLKEFASSYSQLPDLEQMFETPTTRPPQIY